MVDYGRASMVRQQVAGSIKASLPTPGIELINVVTLES